MIFGLLRIIKNFIKGILLIIPGLLLLALGFIIIYLINTGELKQILELFLLG
jgi:hypothetical protein